MREILFRAKRLDNGEWVEGFIVARQANTYPDGFEIIETDGINYDELDFWQPAFQSYGVYPKTICQYTGLTDKNGNKIWENDVVFCKQYIGGNQIDYHIEKGYVEMKHGAFGLHRLKPDAYYRPFKDWLEGYEYEVIGNIFDNPELMERMG